MKTEKNSSLERSGLLAQIIQHEIDHLNGILFTDKAIKLERVRLSNNMKIVFFGTAEFSVRILEILFQK